MLFYNTNPFNYIYNYNPNFCINNTSVANFFWAFATIYQDSSGQKPQKHDRGDNNLNLEKTTWKKLLLVEEIYLKIEDCQLFEIQILNPILSIKMFFQTFTEM